MTTTAELHFRYIIGILLATIIGLLSFKLADNQLMVGYISFALTLSSILLALIAIVHAFISNGSLSQSIGSLHQAAADIRTSAASVDRLASGLEREFSQVTAKLAATHSLVQGLANPAAPAIAHEPKVAKQPTPIISGDMVAHSSKVGKLAMHLAAGAFKRKVSFPREAASLQIGKKQEIYVYGWLMALDAVKLIEIDQSKDDIWTIKSVAPDLLKQITAATQTASTDSADGGFWTKEKIKKIDDYLDTLSSKDEA